MGASGAGGGEGPDGRGLVSHFPGNSGKSHLCLLAAPLSRVLWSLARGRRYGCGNGCPGFQGVDLGSLETCSFHYPHPAPATSGGFPRGRVSSVVVTPCNYPPCSEAWQLWPQLSAVTGERASQSCQLSLLTPRTKQGTTYYYCFKQLCFGITFMQQQVLGITPQHVWKDWSIWVEYT